MVMILAAVLMMAGFVRAEEPDTRDAEIKLLRATVKGQAEQIERLKLELGKLKAGATRPVGQPAAEIRPASRPSSNSLKDMLASMPQDCYPESGDGWDEFIAAHAEKWCRTQIAGKRVSFETAVSPTVQVSEYHGAFNSSVIVLENSWKLGQQPVQINIYSEGLTSSLTMNTNEAMAKRIRAIAKTGKFSATAEVHTIRFTIDPREKGKVNVVVIVTSPSAKIE